MGRKDYELIARILREARPNPARYTKSDYTWARSTWTTVVRVAAHRLGEENPTFDAERFVKACEKEL